MVKISKLLARLKEKSDIPIVYGHSKKKGKCGKICFDKKGAQTKKNWLERKGRERSLRVYNCPECEAWHLTSKTKEAWQRRK